MKTRAGKFLLVIAGLILAFMIAEVLVWVFLSQDKMVTWIEMHPRGFMMNQENIDAIHHFNGRKLQYHFNENGLRSQESVQKDATNILLLGDSFTFGLLLNRDDTYASILQENLDEKFSSRNIQILNGGVGGAGLADWPAWLDHIGREISPDIVIYYLNYMDVDRALSKNLYVLDEQDSTLTESIRWKPRTMFMSLGRMGWYRWLQKHSEVMNIMVKIAWRYLYFSDQTNEFDQESTQVPIPSEEAFYPESGYSVQLAQRLKKRMENWCEQNNCNFILTTTGFLEEGSIGAHTKAYYESLVQKSDSTRLFFDNTPCVKEKVNNNYDNIRIPEDSHPNERGAEIIAECSLNWLQPYLEQRLGAP